jgi:hypothetical protein
MHVYMCMYISLTRTLLLLGWPPPVVTSCSEYNSLHDRPTFNRYLGPFETKCHRQRCLDLQSEHYADVSRSCCPFGVNYARSHDYRYVTTTSIH